MSDNRPEEEIAALFAAVLNDAEAADAEAFDAFATEAEERMSFLLNSGAIPIHVNEMSDGMVYVSVPAPIMFSLTVALQEYIEADNQLAHYTQMGMAAIATEPINDDFTRQALVVKLAFITLAMSKHQEGKAEAE